MEITLKSLVSFGQLRFWVLAFALQAGSGGARRVVCLGEVLGALPRELGYVVVVCVVVVDLVEHLENQLCEQLGAQCRLG